MFVVERSCLLRLITYYLEFLERNKIKFKSPPIVEEQRKRKIDLFDITKVQNRNNNIDFFRGNNSIAASKAYKFPTPRMK